MRTMKKLIMLIGFAMLVAACGNNQTSESKTSENETSEYGIAKVEVFYFHATRRCPTCNKIEDISKDFVAQQYKDQDVKYYSVNFEDSQNKEITQKYSITWSSLIISSGDEHEDITDLAFQVINSDPSQLTNRMQNLIDEYLSK